MTSWHPRCVTDLTYIVGLTAASRAEVTNRRHRSLGSGRTTGTVTSTLARNQVWTMALNCGRASLLRTTAPNSNVGLASNEDTKVLMSTASTTSRRGRPLPQGRPRVQDALCLVRPVTVSCSASAAERLGQPVRVLRRLWLDKRRRRQGCWTPRIRYRSRVRGASPRPPSYSGERRTQAEARTIPVPAIKFGPLDPSSHRQIRSCTSRYKRATGWLRGLNRPSAWRCWPLGSPPVRRPLH